MARGKPKPRKGNDLNAWRSRQAPGAIMKPSTFQSIVSSAEKRGLSAESAKKEAGAAYWGAAKKKYKQSHHSAADGDFLASRKAKFGITS